TGACPSIEEVLALATAPPRLAHDEGLESDRTSTQLAREASQADNFRIAILSPGRVAASAARRGVFRAVAVGWHVQGASTQLTSEASRIDSFRIRTIGSERLSAYGLSAAQWRIGSTR